MIAAASAQGVSILTNLKSAHMTLGGGRVSGGSVMPNALHPVNENGAPEMLISGGRQFLMTGSKGGTVVSGADMMAGGGSRTPNITIINNGTPQEIEAVDITREEVVIIAKDAAQTAVETVNGSLRSGRGDTAESLQGGFQVTRRVR